MKEPFSSLSLPLPPHPTIQTTSSLTLSSTWTTRRLPAWAQWEPPITHDNGTAAAAAAAAATSRRNKLGRLKTTATATTTATTTTAAAANHDAPNNNNNKNQNILGSSWPLLSSLKKEEFYLRQAAYLHIARNIDQAYYKTWSWMMISNNNNNNKNDSCCCISKALLDFFSKFQPLDDNHDNLHGKKEDHSSCNSVEDEQEQRNDCNVSLLSKYLEEDDIMQQDEDPDDHDSVMKHHYHPSLLPIAMVKVNASKDHHHGPQDCVQMSCILRQEMSKYQRQEQQQQQQQQIQQGMIPSQSRKLAAICTVSSCPGQSIYKDHGDIVYQIMCQCIAQEPNPHLYSHLLHRQRRKRVKRKRILGGTTEDDFLIMVEDGGYSDRFVKYYASVTETFHSIIVIVSDVENFSRQELQQLFHLWSSWREECGIPVGVVLLLNSVVEKQVLSTLDSVFSPNVSRNWVVQEFFLDFETTHANVSTGAILKRFLEEFNNPKEGGCRCNLLISPQWMDDLLEDFDRYHRSLAQFVLQFKQVFAHHFAKRGSFLVLVNCRSFMDRYGVNVAWFCTDSIARNFMLGSLVNHCFPHSSKLLDDIHEINAEFHYRYFLCDFLIAFGRFVVHIDDISLLLIGDNFTMLGHSVDQSRKYAMFLEMVYKTVRDLPLQDLMNALTQSYRAAYASYQESLSSEYVFEHVKSLKHHGKSYDIDMNRSAKYHEKAKQFARVMRTNICLLRELQLHLQETESHDIVCDFRESLVEQLHAFCWENDNRDWQRLPLFPLMSYGVEQNDSGFSNLAPPTAIEHRSHVTSAISKPICLEDDRAFDVSVAFHVMDTRIISLNYWFEQFTERILSYTDGSATPKELFQRFAFAAYQLILCGNVVRSRRKSDAFERSAMVWAAASHSS